MKTFIPGLSRRDLFTIGLVLLEVVIFSIISENFFNSSNLRSVLRNATELSLVSIGMTIVILMGGIDISVGSALGVVAIIVGWLIQAAIHPLVIGLVAILVGTTIGFINGSLITFGRIPDIIATLGMSNILRAAVFGMLGGRWITGLPPVFSPLVQGQYFGIPASIIVIFIFYLVFWILLTFLPIGRHIYATGNNLEAAKLSGIDVRKTRIIGYMLLGSLVGFSSLLYVGRLGSVEITVGIDLPISAIAAVVIGGASVFGGRGSIIGTLAGVFFMAFMKNGLLLLGIPSLWERAVIGFLIIFSVGVDLLINKRQTISKYLRFKIRQPRIGEA